MAFEELQFTKSWENAEDFPTFEQDETRVRADMQLLYNEIRDFINSKLVGTLNTNGADSVLTSSGKSIETVLAELEEQIKELSEGTVTDDEEGLGWDLNMGWHRITNLADPVDGKDAATKSFVEDAVKDAVEDSVDYVLRVGASAPDDTRMLWMDTAAKTLKYFDGTGWAAVVSLDVDSTQITKIKDDVAKNEESISELKEQVAEIEKCTCEQMYTYGMDDLIAGKTELAEGKVHYVYE